MNTKSFNTTTTGEAKSGRANVLSLMHELESSVAAASFERTDDWAADVGTKLSCLRDALFGIRQTISSNDGLFAEIVEEHPRLLPQIDALKQEYADLEWKMESTQEQICSPDKPINVADIRVMLGTVMHALKHVQARETEIVFEAIGTDLGVGD